jgi:hypothetical protein
MVEKEDRETEEEGERERTQRDRRRNSEGHRETFGKIDIIRERREERWGRERRGMEGKTEER